MNLPVANLSTSPTARFLAVEIGGTKLQIVAGQADGTILHRERLTVDRARGAEGIREQIATTVPKLISAWQPLAIGVGYGGPVNWRTGRIVKSYHVPGWHDFPLGSWLSELLRTTGMWRRWVKRHLVRGVAVIRCFMSPSAVVWAAG
jgi:predicted NBD/HSP70 family sugar kinase